MAVESYGWDRIAVGGQPHDHAFSRDGGEVRTAVVTVDGDEAHVVAGLTDLVVLKTTGSEFWGFPRDRYTTLRRDPGPDPGHRGHRALALHAAPTSTSTPAYAGVRTALLETFAATHSLALQQSLFAMGEAVLEQVPDVAEIRLSMPNKHHFLQDLSAFGLDNPRRRLPRRRPALRPDRGHACCATTSRRPRSPGRAPPASAERLRRRLPRSRSRRRP